MYEDKKRGRLRVTPFVFRLLIGILVILLLFILFYSFKKISVPNITKEQDYKTNLHDMKTAAFEYFTKISLPKEVGDSKELTLEEMVDQKLLYDFSSDGRKCDLKNSYIKATKTYDGNYALKVSLKCGKYDDFIITTIENKDICESDCIKELIKEEVKKEENKKEESKKESVTQKETSTKKTTTVKKEVSVIKEIFSISVTLPCNSCKSKPEPKPEPKPEKVKWYKHEKTDYVKYNDYCPELMSTYYTTSWLSVNTAANHTYKYTVKLLNTKDFINGSVKLSQTNYFNNYNDYKTFLDTFEQDLIVMNMNPCCNPLNAPVNNFMNSSLKKSNFNYSVSSVYKKGNDYYLDITIKYLNSYNVVPYKFSDIYCDVYFVPLKFNLLYAKNGTCVADLDSNKHLYPNYFVTNSTTKKETIYKWSTSQELEGYKYTGVFEYR